MEITKPHLFFGLIDFLHAFLTDVDFRPVSTESQIGWILGSDSWTCFPFKTQFIISYIHGKRNNYRFRTSTCTIFIAFAPFIGFSENSCRNTLISLTQYILLYSFGDKVKEHTLPPKSLSYLSSVWNIETPTFQKGTFYALDSKCAYFQQKNHIKLWHELWNVV